MSKVDEFPAVALWELVLMEGHLKQIDAAEDMGVQLLVVVHALKCTTECVNQRAQWG